MRGSIVIASFNEEMALVRTVEYRIETADRLDPEILVADDGSSDGSIDELRRRFPRVRIVQHAADDGESLVEPSRPRIVSRGASPTNHLGTTESTGDVLLFLDGHCRPEPGAIRRLAEVVEHVRGLALVIPTIAALCTKQWHNKPNQVGHGYFLDLERFHCGWLPLSELQAVDVDGRRFHESPAAIGCAFAVSRGLHERLWGFDSHMRGWGVEDLDLSLKCWLAGKYKGDAALLQAFDSARLCLNPRIPPF